MPLKIRLKPREKIIVNGAVLTAEDTAGATLVLHNKANILRARDIMQLEEATTPARRIYFTIMLMYIDPENRDRYAPDYLRLLTERLDASALPEVQRTLLLIHRDVEAGELYRAMKTTRALIRAEDALMGVAPDADAAGATEE